MSPLPPTEFRKLTAEEQAEVFDRADEILELRYRSAGHGYRQDPAEDVVHVILTKGAAAGGGAHGAARQILQRWGSWDAVRQANEDALAAYLKTVGLYRPRAHRLKEALQRIHDDNVQSGRSGTSLAWLRGMPLKDASLYLAVLPGLTETDARRIASESRLDADLESDPRTIRVLERLDLLDLDSETNAGSGSASTRGKKQFWGVTVPRRLDIEAFRLNLIQHSRATCHNREPDCGQCPLISFCETGRSVYQGTGEPVAVEAFAGGGGMGEGFTRAGFDVAIAVEIDRDAAQTYRVNHPGTVVLEADATAVTGDDLISLVPRAENPAAIMAGPPCQGYSVAGKRQAQDTRNNLYTAVVDLASKLKPRFVVIENVPGMRRVGGESYVQTVIDALADVDYDTREHLLRACDYGVPQLRRRMIFLAQRADLGTAPKAPEQSGCPGVHCKKCSRPGMRDCGLPPVLSVLDRLTGLPYFEAGGGHEYVPSANGGLPLTNATTMAHSRTVVKKIAGISAGSGPISYRRLHADVARTIVAGHRALPVHPTLNRTISVREAARIQGFGDEHVFAGIRSRQPLQVANAVPPALAQAVADVLIELLNVEARGGEGSRESVLSRELADGRPTGAVEDGELQPAV